MDQTAASGLAPSIPFLSKAKAAKSLAGVSSTTGAQMGTEKKARDGRQTTDPDGGFSFLGKGAGPTHRTCPPSVLQASHPSEPGKIKVNPEGVLFFPDFG
jgi:hypothetical protein